MTPERLAEIRARITGHDRDVRPPAGMADDLLAALDAERAAHEETRRIAAAVLHVRMSAVLDPSMLDLSAAIDRAQKAERERDAASEEREYHRRAEHAAITKRVAAEAERDELRAALAGLREAAKRWTSAEESYEIICSEGHGDGGRDPKRLQAAGAACDEAAKRLRLTIASAPADLAAQYRAEVRRAVLLEAAAGCPDVAEWRPFSEWLDALAAKEGP